MNRKPQNQFVFAFLLVLVTVYNCIVYLQPSSSSAPLLSPAAIEGEKIWQKQNCVSCHQLYGLGGYLGPDLTNVVSHPGKSKPYFYSMFNGGMGAMPEFEFTNEEKHSLYEFLSHVNKTGFYPVVSRDKSTIGWVELNYK